MDVIVRAHLHHLRLRGLSPGTVDARRRSLARLTRRLHPVPLLDATEADILAARVQLEVSASTVGDYLSHARQFYSWAVSAGLLQVNPCEKIPVPRQPRRLPRPIGEADLMRAVETAPPRVRPWLVLAGWAGLRAKEIALLRRECVLERADPPVLLVASDATKGRRERVVPLGPFVLEELVPLLPARGWVFRRGDGQPGPNQPWMISRHANNHLHECGIPETLHQLRHRFGTMAYQRGGRDLRAVQELMGHADPMTTAGYAAYDQAAAVAAVEALPHPGRYPRLRPVPARRAEGES